MHTQKISGKHFMIIMMIGIESNFKGGRVSKNFFPRLFMQKSLFRKKCMLKQICSRNKPSQRALAPH